MALLDWFRQSTPKIDENKFSASLVEDTIDYVVKMTDARLTLVNHYRARLTGPVSRTLQYLGTLRSNLPATHPVAPHSWSQDPTIRAVFGQPDDLLAVFAHCQPLHDFATQDAGTGPIYAVLAMHFSEQTHFGVDMQGSVMVRDVAQTSLGFNHHHLRLFARSEQELMRSVARRMLDELALIALDRMQAEQTERRELEEHRSLLSARLSTFHQRGTGLDSFLDTAGDAISNEESTELLHHLEQNETRLAALGSPAETLDRQIDYLAEILAEPMRFINFELRHPRVDSMNVIDEGGEEIEFGLVSVDRQPPKQRVFIPVLVDRALVGDGRRLRLDNAERWL
jgi:hypothetical protein